MTCAASSAENNGLISVTFMISSGKLEIGGGKNSLATIHKNLIVKQYRSQLPAYPKDSAKSSGGTGPIEYDLIVVWFSKSSSGTKGIWGFAQ